MMYLITMVSVMTVLVNAGEKITSKVAMEQFLEEFNVEGVQSYYDLNVASWNYFTNITKHNTDLSNEATVNSTLMWKRFNNRVNNYKWEDLEDDWMKRQFHMLNQTGLAILDTKSLQKLSKLESTMQSIYSNARVCGIREKCMKLDPGVTELLANNRDYDKLKLTWKLWRDESGKKMKSEFTKLVTLLNKAARLNGYEDEGDRWRKLYETKTFREDVAKLYETVKPLYQHLHAYVKRKLQTKYSDNQFSKDGHIPAHLFGNMWSQSWNNIESIVKPFINGPVIDVTSAMIKQNYDAKKMFKTAESFFISLGLPKMVDTFWKYSMFVRPNNRSVVCHASAWDFYAHNDFRIKMCTKVVFEDLVTIHHEMGHIQYYMNYQKKPVLYRDGANNGFHEAIGDVMALSASTPGHLNKIGLLDKFEENEEFDINFLMSMALEKVAFLPFGYMIDSWRWGVFDGSVKPENYTRHWWELRCKLQGIYPPVERSSEDFDPGAKYHVAGNVAYIRYFVADIIEFQFHEALCKEADQKVPLHKCDIYKSRKAGAKLKEMLSMGASKPWPEAMKAITGQEKMSADSIMKYFDPLYQWLKKENAGYDIEWKEECPSGSFSAGSASFISFNMLTILGVSMLSMFYLY